LQLLLVLVLVVQVATSVLQAVMLFPKLLLVALPIFLLVHRHRAVAKCRFAVAKEAKAGVL
jgi:hypothetical protein